MLAINRRLAHFVKPPAIIQIVLEPIEQTFSKPTFVGDEGFIKVASGQQNFFAPLGVLFHCRKLGLFLLFHRVLFAPRPKYWTCS